MHTGKTTALLLERACPSIQYRLRKEVLGQPASSPEMLSLQDRILEDGAVKEITGWQQPDGWLAWDFHGAQSTEAGIRRLCEKGVEPGQPVLRAALQALECLPDRLSRGLGKPGRVLDDLGLGGARLIQAAMFACAGIEETPLVQEQTRVALAGFTAVRAVDSTAGLFEMRRGKRVLNPGTLWPGIYHLRLLAWTHGWRTPENCRQVREAVKRLIRLSPIPEFSVWCRSQLIAPPSFCMRDFNPDFAALDDAGWMMAFHRLELLARLGVVRGIPELERQVSGLEDRLADGDGLFTNKLSHPYFHQWGAYTGLRLEQDWREATRRINDLTFRSLLILHYAHLEAGSAMG
jgi:hypothetical protein